MNMFAIIILLSYFCWCVNLIWSIEQLIKKWTILKYVLWLVDITVLYCIGFILVLYYVGIICTSIIQYIIAWCIRTRSMESKLHSGVLFDSRKTYPSPSSLKTTGYLETWWQKKQKNMCETHHLLCNSLHLC